MGIDQDEHRMKTDALRSPEMLKLLEVERVVELCLEKLFITKVLDVGTGTGIFAEAFALRNLNVTGVDNDPLMLKTATDLVADAHFQRASAEVLPFGPGTYDLVFLGPVLHESNDPVRALKEANRVAASRVALLEWPYLDERVGPPLERRIHPDKIRNMARRAGFSEIGKCTLGHMVLFRFQTGKKAETIPVRRSNIKKNM